LLGLSAIVSSPFNEIISIRYIFTQNGKSSSRGMSWKSAFEPL